MKLSRYEQETVVNYNAGEQTATVYTRDKTVMRKLDTLVAEFPDIYKLTGQDDISKTYSFPKSYVNYRKPRRISKEQREQAREMMLKINLSDSNQWKLLSPVYNFWSLSEGIYRTISFMSQSKMRHKSFSVCVDTLSLCFKRWRVLSDKRYLCVKVYQLSIDFSKVCQNGE